MKKNIKKAIAISEFLINAHNKNAEGMEEMVKDWKLDTKGLGLSIASTHRDVASCIQLIIDQLELEKPKRKKIETASN